MCTGPYRPSLWSVTRSKSKVKLNGERLRNRKAVQALLDAELACSHQGNAIMYSPLGWGRLYCAARNASCVCMICVESFGSGSLLASSIRGLVGSSAPHLRDGVSAMFVGEATHSIHTAMLFCAATCQKVATIWLTTGLFAVPLINAFLRPCIVYT